MLKKFLPLGLICFFTFLIVNFYALEVEEASVSVNSNSANVEFSEPNISGEPLIDRVIINTPDCERLKIDTISASPINGIVSPAPSPGLVAEAASVEFLLDPVTPDSMYMTDITGIFDLSLCGEGGEGPPPDYTVGVKRETDNSYGLLVDPPSSTFCIGNSSTITVSAFCPFATVPCLSNWVFTSLDGHSVPDDLPQGTDTVVFNVSQFGVPGVYTLTGTKVNSTLSAQYTFVIASVVSIEYLSEFICIGSTLTNNDFVITTNPQGYENSVTVNPLTFNTLGDITVTASCGSSSATTTVLVLGISKIMYVDSLDVLKDGPATLTLGDAISLEAIPTSGDEFPPSANIEWSVISKPSSSNIPDSLNGNKRLRLTSTDLDVAGIYVIQASCGTSSALFTVNVNGISFTGTTTSILPGGTNSSTDSIKVGITIFPVPTTIPKISLSEGGNGKAIDTITIGGTVYTGAAAPSRTADANVGNAARPAEIGVPIHPQ